ncbi:MAG: SIR2 family protein [Pseudomonadota bacterium]
MADPSALPSAATVSAACYDKYVVAVDPGLDAALKWDLEKLAEHFATLKTLTSMFIRTLVPWEDFHRPPNAGHAAVADFLLTGAAPAALSSNYDTLIEDCALDFGADFRASLDGDQARVHAASHAPLLKFHGCMNLDRDETVWTPSQLTGGVIADRIAKSKTWMANELREKDILVVGFWTDWHYLNAIISDALQGVSPLSVTVVAPVASGMLQAKAPALWDLAHADHVVFDHVSEDGAAFLDSLRRAYSRAFLRKVVAAGRVEFEAIIHGACDASRFACPDYSSEVLYRLRRDAEGVPTNKPARQKSPTPSAPLGLFHLQLRQAGAIPTETGYTFNGTTIRVVNGANQILSKMAAKFQEAPAVDESALTAAIGAEDVPLPASVVRTGMPGSIMRPAARSRWVTYAGAVGALGL